MNFSTPRQPMMPAAQLLDSSAHYHNSDLANPQVAYAPIVNGSSSSQIHNPFTDGENGTLRDSAFINPQMNWDARFPGYQSSAPDSCFSQPGTGCLSQSHITSHPSFGDTTIGSFVEARGITSPQSCPDPHSYQWGAASSHSSQLTAPSIVIHQPRDSRQQQEQDLAHVCHAANSFSVARAISTGESQQTIGDTSDEMCMLNPQLQTRVESSTSRSRSQSLTSPSGRLTKQRRPRIRNPYTANSLPDVKLTPVREDQTQQTSVVPGIPCSICRKTMPRHCDLKCVSSLSSQKM